MKADTIENNYEIIYGQEKYDSRTSYNAVTAHGHYTRDVTSRLRNLVHAAAAAEIDVMAVTGHDTPREYDKVSHAVSNYGYPIVVYSGIEVSARGPTNSIRHVLVYGVEDAPPPGLSPPEVNEWAHGHTGRNVYTAAAHPELLTTSVRREELQLIQQRPLAQRFDFGEIVNGEILSLTAWRKKHPWTIPLTRKMLPENANDTMREVVFAQHALPPIGGDDSHNVQEIGNVINLVPEKMDIFDAALSGNVLIAVRRTPQATATWRIGVGYIRGTRMVHQVFRQWKQGEF